MQFDFVLIQMEKQNVLSPLCQHLKASFLLTYDDCIADITRAFSPKSIQNLCLPEICAPGRLAYLASFPFKESCQLTGKWDRQKTCSRDLICFLSF